MDIHHHHEGLSSFDEMIAKAPDAPPAVVSSPLESVTARPGAAACPTMSSLQIAEITGKNHKDVMRDIREVLEQAGIGERKFALTYRDTQNKARPCYHLPRRECDLVISGYSVKYRLAIIDRWRELEARPAQVDIAAALSDPNVLRSLLLANTEKVLALETAVSELSPKAEALDRIAEAGGSMCITDAAKALQIQPRALGAWLDSQGWTYRRHGNRERVPYQHRIQSGDMVAKSYTYKNSLGEESISERALVTAKGLTTLARKLSKEVGR